MFSTAAWNMPGSFDWTPYLPMVYARIMKNLELPVYFKGAKYATRDSSSKQFDFASIGRWMVSTLVCSKFKTLELLEIITIVMYGFRETTQKP